MAKGYGAMDDVVVEPESMSMELSARELTIKTDKEVTLLDNVTTTFRSGTLSAVMGPSGAGKTSLFRALSGRLPGHWTRSGGVRANGRVVREGEFKDWGSVAPSDDVLLTALTPRELLTYGALIRGVPSSRVDVVIANLELEDCADTFAAMISGGERRRTSLALELVHAPSVLLADEPTSGLDARAARLVVEKLKNIATTSRATVVCTIHQPSHDLFETFDNVVVMAKATVCFEGSPPAAITYFRANLLKPQHFGLANPAEAIIECIGDDPGPATDKWRETRSDDDDDKQGVRDQETDDLYDEDSSSSKKKLRTPSAMRWIFARALTNTWRGVGSLQIRACAITALFIAIPFWRGQDTQRRGSALLGAYFLSASFHGTFTTMTTVTLVPSEIPTLRREYYNGLYTISEYLVARLAVASVLQVAACFAYTVVFFPLVHRGGDGGDGEASFLTCFLAFVMLGLFGNYLGVFIGSVASNQETATLLLSPCALPPIMCAGYFFQKSELTKSVQLVLYPIWYISYIRYGFSILVVNEFRHGVFRVCNDGDNYCPYNSYVHRPEDGVDHDVIPREYLDIPQGTVLPYYFFILTGFAIAILVLLGLAVKFVTLAHD